MSNVFDYTIENCYLTYRTVDSVGGGFAPGANPVNVIRIDDHTFELYTPKYMLTIRDSVVLEEDSRVENLDQIIAAVDALPRMNICIDSNQLFIVMHTGHVSAWYNYGNCNGFGWNGEWLTLYGALDNIHLNSQTYEAYVEDAEFWFKFDKTILLKFMTIDDESSAC